jgi:exodeoxyribonuclease VIII
MIITPGIHWLSNEDYHAANGLSRSGIVRLQKSPLHFHARSLDDNVEDETSYALTFGSAFDTYLLDNENFSKKYHIADKPNQTTKIGKAAWEVIKFEARGKLILSTADLHTIVCMTDSLMSREAAQTIINNKRKHIQPSIFWNDPDTGTLLKACPDIVLPNQMADIKTTRDASLRKFAWASRDYGYGIQAAMSLDGWEIAKGDKIEIFTLMAVEKIYPFATGFYLIDADSIQRARDEYKEEVQKYSQYVEQDIWPSYESAFLSIPA